MKTEFIYISKQSQEVVSPVTLTTQSSERLCSDLTVVCGHVVPNTPTVFKVHHLFLIFFAGYSANIVIINGICAVLAELVRCNSNG